MTYTEKDPNGKKGTMDPLLDNQKGTTFAERLRIAIGDKSIRQFAIDCGISYGAMHKYFTGTTQPTLDNLVILSKTAGVGIEWLATGQNSPVLTGTELQTVPAASGALDVHGNDVDLGEFRRRPRWWELCFR